MKSIDPPARPSQPILAARASAPGTPRDLPWNRARPLCGRRVRPTTPCDSKSGRSSTTRPAEKHSRRGPGARGRDGRSARDRRGRRALPIVRELGSGGMGAVYLAERADGEFEQRVAIKVVRGGFGTPFLLERFREERRILASLEHPNIAR